MYKLQRPIWKLLIPHQILRNSINDKPFCYFSVLGKSFSTNAHSVDQKKIEPRIDSSQIPTLKEFLKAQAVQKQPETSLSESEDVMLSPYKAPQPPKFYIETYGCQMNVADSEIVRSVLSSSGYQSCATLEEADIILTNTCAIRENAEIKVKNRLKYFQSIRKKNRISRRQLQKESRLMHKSELDSSTDSLLSAQLEEESAKELKKQLSRQSIYPLVGVLGCMAERMKEKLLLEDSVDFICGPDAYRDIPRLLHRMIQLGEKQSNTSLSYHETYADITPVRDEKSSVSAFVSIMRGCNNMCSFCIVPFTRGRERSRPLLSIIQEVEGLVQQGIKEIVVLGQNVNGYHDTAEDSLSFLSKHPLFTASLTTDNADTPDLNLFQQYKATPGFMNMYTSKKKDLPGIRFAHLLSILAELFPEVRIRFTSPHPKDFPEEVLDVIRSYYNICSSIHLPLQSGSTTVLQRMRRGYSREAYEQLVQRIREKIPNVTLSTDIITGFCAETEEEHQETLSLMNDVAYEQAFMFAYSIREKTHAYYNYEDNISEEIKQRRLNEVIDLFRKKMIERNQQSETGRVQVVLVEGESMKSNAQQVTYTGRTDGNKRVIFPVTDLPSLQYDDLIKLSSSFQKNEKLGLTTMPSLPDLLSGNVNDWSEEVKNHLLVHGVQADFAADYFLNRRNKDELVGEYVLVKILKANSATLRGVAFARTTLTDMRKFSEQS